MSGAKIIIRPRAPPPSDPAFDDGTADDMDVDPDAELDPDADPLATEGDEALPRGRGRPRGRSRGGTPTPGARARGRGRGRGRGRARGSALVIRLPRRGDEDGDGGDEDVTPADADGPIRRVHGVAYVVVNDELAIPDDPVGDTKIDMHGNLLGGRRFKAATFVLPTRDPNRAYMLAIDAARTSGFRDSLYYFRRTPLAHKLTATPAEKEHLIAQGKLGAHLRTRSVTLVTARSAFKLHGAKMIIDGRWVVDDYDEARALAEITPRGLKAGDPVGELPDPQPTASEAPAPTAAAAPPGGGGVYRAGGPTTVFGGAGWGPFSDGPLNAVRKGFLNREGVAEDNWMFAAAERVGAASAEWARVRRKHAGADGVYEPHTGAVFYRADTQPTRARWETVGGRTVLGGTKVGNGAWGLAWVDTVLELPADALGEERMTTTELPVDVGAVNET